MHLVLSRCLSTLRALTAHTKPGLCSAVPPLYSLTHSPCCQNSSSRSHQGDMRQLKSFSTSCSSSNATTSAPLRAARLLSPFTLPTVAHPIRRLQNQPTSRTSFVSQASTEAINTTSRSSGRSTSSRGGSSRRWLPRGQAVQASTEGSSSGSSAMRPPPDGQQISSTSNPYIKHCVKLRDNSRYRQQQQRLLVAGTTLLRELAEASQGGLQAVILFTKQGAPVPPGLSADSVITVTDAVMKKLTGLEETSGVQLAAELNIPPFVDLLANQQQQQQEHSQQHQGQLQQPNLQQQPHQHQQQQPQQYPSTLQLQRLLVLEGVQDPGNLGTLLRCAAAFGWDAVWLLPGCCDPFNDKALRASRGAGFKVPLAAGTLEQLLQVVHSSDMLLLAAEPDPEAAAAGGTDASASTHSHAEAADLHTPGSSSSSSSRGIDAPQGFSSRRVALVLGSEGSGLSAAVLAAAEPLAVPMEGDMESLNVGVAGSILMFCLSPGWIKLTGRLQQLQLLP